MRRSMLALLAIAAAGLMNVGGCSPGKDLTKPTLKKNAHEHDETGPHQGTLVEWDEYHAEFTVDHGKKQATVYVLDEKAEKAAPIEAETILLILKHEKTPIEITMKASPEAGEPKGSSSKFVATHDAFGNETEFRGTLRAKVGDKTYEDDFEEKKGHKHEKK